MKIKSVFLKEYRGCKVYYQQGRDRFFAKVMNLELWGDSLGGLEIKIRQSKATALLGTKLLGLPVLVHPFNFRYREERWVKGRVVGIGHPRHPGGPYCLKVKIGKDTVETVTSNIRVATIQINRLKTMQQRAYVAHTKAAAFAAKAPKLDSFESAEAAWASL